MHLWVVPLSTHGRPSWSPRLAWPPPTIGAVRIERAVLLLRHDARTREPARKALALRVAFAQVPNLSLRPRRLARRVVMLHDEAVGRDTNERRGGEYGQ